MDRLFIGLGVEADWPESFPEGRILEPRNRHLTLVFLGNHTSHRILNELDSLPVLRKVGLAGYFDSPLFIPPSHPRVVSWHVAMHEGLGHLQAHVAEWIRELGYTIDARTFLPHLTIARAPFEVKKWEDHFKPLPWTTDQIHLYRSMGNLQYEPLWSHTYLSPIEQIDHPADFAFLIRGESFKELYFHAITALSMACSALLDSEIPLPNMGILSSLDGVIEGLNERIAVIDGKWGIELKGVPYSHSLRILEDGVLEWEMIVDV
ncbi:MAG: hypothetical protein KDK40_03250 [Chlamydiia bacterium]|nr:hypothetical protein [Chlamydiia bacterium]